MARNSELRKACSNPRQYDWVIDLIKERNPAARASGDAEEWASGVVNKCIDSLLHPDPHNRHGCSHHQLGDMISTGEAFAILVRPGEVHILYQPLGDPAK